MKQILTSLTLAVLAFAGLVGHDLLSSADDRTAAAQADAVITKTAPTTATYTTATPPLAASAPVVTPVPGADPTKLLQQAFLAIDTYGSISAKLRQRSELYGVSAIGSGVYSQGSAASHRLRLEMTFQIGSRRTSFQQIADGEYLWTRRELASAPTLTRVNIDRVLQIQEHNPHEPFRKGYVMGLGGLPRLLASLPACFNFDSVNQTTLGTMPMYIVRGVWNRNALSHLLRDQKEAILAGQPADLTKLTEQVPDEVLVYLGREDLFPYRFEYRRTPASQTAVGSEPPQLRTMMVLEFFEVQINESIDPTMFLYEPGELDFDDETNHYIYRFGVWPR